MSNRRRHGKLRKLTDVARTKRENKWAKKKDRAARMWAKRHVQERTQVK